MPDSQDLYFQKLLVPHILTTCQTSPAGCLPLLTVTLAWSRFFSQVKSCHSPKAAQAQNLSQFCLLGSLPQHLLNQPPTLTIPSKSLYMNDSFHSLVQIPNSSWIVIHSGARIILLSPTWIHHFLHHLPNEGKFLILHSRPRTIWTPIIWFTEHALKFLIPFLCPPFPLWLLKLCPF